MRPTAILFVCLLAGLLGAMSSAGQFVHQLNGPVYPWTSEPNVSGDKYRFVIISDLTGGEKPGVFESVVEKINQLAPDFVMCVGDLVDGYTLDPAVMKEQWENFHHHLSKLKSPFFYMPGNHDVANSMLFNEWIRQYGYDYYSFYMGKTLFLIMNCYESPEEGVLSDKQVNYFKSVLQAHNPADPVCIFSHPPLWDLYHKKGLNELKPLFYQYHTTFFFGDDHRYLKKEFNGRPHYMLSNTGGGFDKENINLGIFNHIFWVTASEGKLTIANILTDGIVPTDVVNDQTNKQVELLLNDRWCSFEPVCIAGKTLDKFTTRLKISNPTDYPLQVSGKFIHLKHLRFEPDSILLTVEPGKEAFVPITLYNTENLLIDQLPEIKFRIKGAFLQDKKEIANASEKTWIIDCFKTCVPKNEKIAPIICDRPGQIEESWSWNGPQDGNFELTSDYDQDNVFIHLKTRDDNVVADSLNPAQPQDKLFFVFSADTSFTQKNTVKIELHAGEQKGRKGEIQGRCKAEKAGLSGTLVISRKLLVTNAFRLNIGFRDQDDTTSSDQSILWWKPLWKSKADYRGSGIFILN